MRATRALLVVFLTVGPLGLVACGGDGRSASEQRYVDALADDLQSSKDGGFAVQPEDAECMSEAVLDTIGAKPFEDAGVQPKDLAGDDSPGELLGKGAVSDAQAKTIADAWADCTDLATAFATAAKDDFELDAKGVECFADGLRGTDTLDAFVEQSFTAAEEDPASDTLQELVKLVGTCSTGEDGIGGPFVESIARSLQEQNGLDAEDATCIAQHVVDTVGPDRLVELTATGDFESAPADAQNELATAIVSAAQACDVPVGDLNG
jgi:hypothetical protein